MKNIILVLIFTSLVNAEVNVIVSKDNTIETITKQELSEIYLKKKNTINGKKVKVLNNKDNYDEFNKKVLNKTPSQMHAYWMKQIFLGKKTPPRNISTQGVQQEMQNDKNTITYTSQKLNEKVIYEAK